MKRNKSLRLGLEVLEDRWCPSVTARVAGDGSLLIKGSSANLQLTQVAAGAFRVVDAGVNRGTFAGVSNGLQVNLRGDNDAVTIDLGGFYDPASAVDSIFVDLGGGDNELAVLNGAVVSSLAVRSGGGTDVVRLGGDGRVVSVGGDVTVLAGGSFDDDLLLSEDLEVQGSVVTVAADVVTMEEGGFVNGDVVLGGSAAADALTIGGTINGSLFVTSGGSADDFDLTETAQVAGGVLVHLGGGDDTAAVAGQVGGSLTLHTGQGNDTVVFSGAVEADASLFLGAGNDRLTFSGQVGFGGDSAGRLLVQGGLGNDAMTFTATAAVNGGGVVRMGDGDDSFLLEQRSLVLNVRVNGGPGQDTFNGNQAMLASPPVKFEFVFDDTGDDEGDGGGDDGGDDGGGEIIPE